MKRVFALLYPRRKSHDSTTLYKYLYWKSNISRTDYIDWGLVLTSLISYFTDISLIFNCIIHLSQSKITYRYVFDTLTFHARPLHFMRDLYISCATFTFHGQPWHFMCDLWFNLSDISVDLHDLYEIDLSVKLSECFANLIYFTG